MRNTTSAHETPRARPRSLNRRPYVLLDHTLAAPVRTTHSGRDVDTDVPCTSRRPVGYQETQVNSLYR